MKPFRVAACQVRAFDIGDAEENLANLLRALDEAGASGANLVLLPECSYPAYYLDDARPYEREGVRPFDEVAGLFAAQARKYGYWLAAGMAVPTANGGVTNSGVVFGPDGDVRGQYDKSFLWHFDNNWFTRGNEFPVFDMEFCRAGILICADGRLPEIARCLAVGGAEVILDLTAWVASGASMESLSNIQCEYMMPVRAFENGAWVVAADKWGIEDGSIVYAGRTCVIGPDGLTRVAAGSTGDAVVTYDLAPCPVETVPRRPALYGRLTEPTERLPVTRLLAEALNPALDSRRIAVAPGPSQFEPRQMVHRFEQLCAQDADLVVFPGMAATEGWQVDLAPLESAVRARGAMLAFGTSTDGCARGRAVTLVTPTGTYEHTATHGRGVVTGEHPSPVVATPLGNVGLTCGDEGLVPEVARALTLEGAEVLVWPLFEEHAMTLPVMRTRADENKVYVAAAWVGGGAVVSPGGAVIAESPAGSGVAMAASVNRALTRWKDMAPGSHVINDRLPASYGVLVR